MIMNLSNTFTFRVSCYTYIYIFFFFALISQDYGEINRLNGWDTRRELNNIEFSSLSLRDLRGHEVFRAPEVSGNQIWCS